MSMRRGFTLIELMVVMTIIALLAGLLMPFISMASRNARRTATQAVMRKVDTALRQFKT
ncbi:MAG: type II secretion system protein, partial [Planctomycetes bacterium]|nr:type II secretion system protein [Planctomycetota bacterium]